jgi:formate-dependent nitrite reductase membrane component NrfD
MITHQTQKKILQAKTHQQTQHPIHRTNLPIVLKTTLRIQAHLILRVIQQKNKVRRVLEERVAIIKLGDTLFYYVISLVLFTYPGTIRHFTEYYNIEVQVIL